MESETADHHVIKISVRGTGIGIPESAQAKLFDRFSQAGCLLTVETNHSTDVQSPPPPPAHACICIHPGRKSCSDLGLSACTQ